MEKGINLKDTNNILINLAEATNRLKDTKEILDGLEIPFKRFDAIKHEKGLVGCGLSHLKLLSVIKPGTVIFEDDIGSMCSTHAILYLSDRYIKAAREVIMEYLNSSRAFDVGLASIHKDFNILTPNDPIFYQTEQPEFTKFSLKV